MDDAAPTPVQVQHALSGKAHFSLGLKGFTFGLVPGNEIGGNSPVGERSRAGIIDLVTQPTTAPSSPT